METYLLFAVTWFAAAATPGGDTMLLLGKSLANGWKSTIPYSFGIIIAKVGMITLTYLGVATLMLQAPAAFGELHGQPVEQLGVRREVALVAEVVLRLHDPAAEVLLPDAVHEYPGGERVRGVIGVDGGSTSSKAVLVDENGEIVGLS
mgnify:CR=1 FL=1